MRLGGMQLSMLEDAGLNRLLKDLYSPSRKNRAMLHAGLTMIALLGLLLIAGSWIARYDPAALGAGEPLMPPSAEHWFGTDALGRDLFSRTVQGFRVSTLICFAATAVTAVPGILAGIIAGYFQGAADRILSRLMEMLLALPGLLLALVLIAKYGSSIQTLIVALGITGIPSFFRVTRNETKSMAAELFVESARSIGASDWRIMIRHILPNIFPTLAVLLSMRVGLYLLMSSGLGFIGLGIQPPTAELGALVASGKEYFQTSWWLLAIPLLSIFIPVLALNLFSEGLRDVQDDLT
ncbi:MAG TPA: ABC transporter permease [Bellilinea sp.]|nr:ABC transporter permease [Bellilinea sp.]